MSKLKSTKLKSKWYRPRTIAALQKYVIPLPMFGDPPYKKGSWENRCKVLYAHAMKMKHDPPAIS